VLRPLTAQRARWLPARRGLGNAARRGGARRAARRRLAPRPAGPGLRRRLVRARNCADGCRAGCGRAGGGQPAGERRHSGGRGNRVPALWRGPAPRALSDPPGRPRRRALAHGRAGRCGGGAGPGLWPRCLYSGDGTA
jgi:hypothetical protein